MDFRIAPMTEERARAIAAWRYPTPYSFYDLPADPDDLAEFLDPRHWVDLYRAVIDADGTLIGFLQTRPDGDAVEIGLGLRPNLTGQGHGTPFLAACLDFARQRYAPARFRLAVATFNRRAITVYERAGFRPVREFMHRTNGGNYVFLLMEREA